MSNIAVVRAGLAYSRAVATVELVLAAEQFCELGGEHFAWGLARA